MSDMELPQITLQHQTASESNDTSARKCRKWAIDIGGTLAKMVCLEVADNNGDLSTKDFFDLGAVGSSHPSLDLFQIMDERSVRLRFGDVRTRDIDLLLSWLQRKGFSGDLVPMTGGGAFKFQEAFQEALQATVVKYDEMLTIMTGLAFLISRPEEVFRFDLPTKTLVTATLDDPLYPYLLVNIGSGVSILKADGPGDFKRLTGTCIGGGTVLGLARLLLGVSTFEEVIDLSQRGTNALDLVVSDLYGDTAGSRCLPGNTLASSLGRLYVPSQTTQLDLENVRREDIARSLVIMVAYNLGYLSYLIGTIHKTYRVIFAGKFIARHQITMAAITEGVLFYTRHYDSMGRRCGYESSPVHCSVSPTRYRARSDHLCTPRKWGVEAVLESQDTLKLKATTYAACQAPKAASSPPRTRARDSGGDRDRSVKSPPTNARGDGSSVSTSPPKSRCPNSLSLHGLPCEALPSQTTNDGDDRVVDDPPSHEKFEVLFLKHDGYLGALGALLLSLRQEGISLVAKFRAHTSEGTMASIASATELHDVQKAYRSS